MKGAAGRPGDASRDAGGPPGRAPEQAEFAISRVGAGGHGRWSRIAALGLAGVLVGMIALAIGGRTPSQSFGAESTPTAAIDAAQASLASPRPTLLDLRVPIVPVQTSDPASTKIRLEIQRQPAEMFVHGDVYVARVTWVFVSLRDATGTVTGWSSVSVPGAAGPAIKGGPTMRFDVQLAVPADFDGALTIQATAYDGTGKVVGSTQMIAPATATPNAAP